MTSYFTEETGISQLKSEVERWFKEPSVEADPDEYGIGIFATN